MILKYISNVLVKVLLLIVGLNYCYTYPIILSTYMGYWTCMEGSYDHFYGKMNFKKLKQIAYILVV